SRRWQERGFRVIAAMQDLRGRIVVDGGAGTGDFGAFLKKRRVRYARYIGLEGVEQMAEKGAESGLARAEFHACDFAREEDVFTRFTREMAGAPGGMPHVIVFSGSLNTFEEEAARGVLARAWEACAEALVFNFLSDRVSRAKVQGDTGPARRFSTVAMLDWALSKTPSVAMRHDYIPKGHDATIAMYREGRAAE
ncbi:MAG: class I SAM-dependent methyltransferase, partial [Planctomycetota bacterium]|nr:class I SAM-dependent methyltransferase [Planctomycetota bacterium]